jgi:hypothetical protein
MVNKKNWLGILVLVFGMTVVGCIKYSTDNNKNNDLIANSRGSSKTDPSLNGIWENNESIEFNYLYKFNKGNFEYYENGYISHNDEK